MEQTLKKLHELQFMAIKKGIYKFDVSATNFEQGLGLTVTIFLKGDDSEDDYGRFELWDLANSLKVIRTINNIKAFINVHA